MARPSSVASSTQPVVTATTPCCACQISHSHSAVALLTESTNQGVRRRVRK